MLCPGAESVEEGTKITIPYPCDFHHHFRQGPAISSTVPVASERFGTALAMPNTKPPITTVPLALKYHEELMAARGGGDMDIVNVLYLTDNTKVETVDEMAKHDFIVGFKYYPAGATTNSDAGVTDFRKCYDVFKRVEELGMVLCIHSEVSDADIDIFDREKVFIDRVIKVIVSDFPNLKIVMEHISTSFGVDFINSLPPTSRVVGSITPHHIMYNRNALLVGGVKPHFYCLPILKRESHRVSLLSAATSRSGRFIMGTDSAPHTVESKESACGCAGVFNGHCAVEMYVEAFEGAGRMDALEDFVEAGKKFYGIEDGGRKMELVKETWEVPGTMEFGENKVKPLRAGEKMLWKIVR
ncbi:hypothetical protein TrRE_jg314 [Triparma retinervis]|uniref:Dihydroorotase n=1 Tax=Triparma retinervis TaxID=2557542 RepID=A0A9W6ZXT5_9STRA|nr:hypothetical protein TrRE_jg314 [Triparma retinervis]